jgi:hypothetical protein
MKATHKPYQIFYFVADAPEVNGGQYRDTTIFARSKSHARLLGHQIAMEAAKNPGYGTSLSPNAIGVVVAVKRIKWKKFIFEA